MVHRIRDKLRGSKFTENEETDGASHSKHKRHKSKSSKSKHRDSDDKRQVEGMGRSDRDKAMVNVGTSETTDSKKKSRKDSHNNGEVVNVTEEKIETKVVEKESVVEKNAIAGVKNALSGEKNAITGEKNTIAVEENRSAVEIKASVVIESLSVAADSEEQPRKKRKNSKEESKSSACVENVQPEPASANVRRKRRFGDNAEDSLSIPLQIPTEPVPETKEIYPDSDQDPEKAKKL